MQAMDESVVISLQFSAFSCHCARRGNAVRDLDAQYAPGAARPHSLRVAAARLFRAQSLEPAQHAALDREEKLVAI
jgi:hypothetical protein